MKILTCDYCGRGLGRTHGVRCCGRSECREKWLHDDAERNRTRAALAIIRDERRASRTRNRQAQEILSAYACDIASMRAGRHDPPPMPGVTCIDCGAVLPESYAADETRCAKCRRRRNDWLLRLGEWRRSRPAPTPGHCPVCGMKTKPGRTWCSDPCANEAAHWEAVAAWLGGTGPDPTKTNTTRLKGAR
ncbi:hypothetical protein [Pseudoscardovia suis]